MFQFRGFPSYTYVFSIWCRLSSPAGFPIRISAGQWIFAPNRSFSQLVTSFVGSWCQVILPTLLLAWPLSYFLSLFSGSCLNYIRIRDIVLLDFLWNWSFTLFLLRKNLRFSSLGFVTFCPFWLHVPRFLLSIIVSILFSFQGTFSLNKTFLLSCFASFLR